ncbi:hypothetical protein ACFU99_00635 [Streptomyces sp. NPDC057654]|uniref:hypothetical protein n=1 Tax=Streptomyces sp. NPDC057654 TaxID=3346196 RepID=UPI0036BC9C87
MTDDRPACFSITFQAAPNLTFIFSGDTPLTVGPNVEAFVSAAPRYADLFQQAQASWNLGALGATVIHSQSN